MLRLPARGLAPLCVLAAILAPARPAAADVLALVDVDPSLREAIEVALAPWGVTVSPLTSTEDEARASGAERGEAVGRRTDAAVLVWLEARGGASVLYVHQPAARATLGQELASAPPFDAPTAAAVALSLKTLLRHSPIDPAAPAPPASVPREAPPEVPPSAPSARAPPPLSLELGIGARAFGTRPDHAELRGSLAVGLWPEALGPHLGVTLRVAAGPGIELDAPRFEGRLVEARVELGLEARFWPIAGLELGAAAGLGARIASLSGRVAPAQQPIERWRASPSATVELRVGARLAPEVWLGVRGGVEVPLVRQRYLVRGEPVLEVGEVALLAVAGAQVGFGRGL